MKFILILALACLAFEATAAATLYRWRDASGVDRYGYQPPPGVEAEPAEDERRKLYEEKAEPIRCEDLARQHVALVDREIERVRETRTGLGAEYAMSPAAQQQLIMDLMAHRAALITGRPASEFRTPSSDELIRSRNQLQSQNQQLQAGLESQEQTIDAQKTQLDRARRKLKYLRPFGGAWVGPGVYPNPYPYVYPYPLLPP
jgi:transposase-like protein